MWSNSKSPVEFTTEEIHQIQAITIDRMMKISQDLEAQRIPERLVTEDMCTLRSILRKCTDHIKP